MDAQLRRVRKLRLRSTDEGLNRRGAILIEDAMRTASLPDADASRLLIVRSLPLGSIRASDPPSAIAIRIEARCRQVGFRAVHAGSAAASSAEAVYFNDDLEPYIALALKIARGEPASEWFWPLAIQTWTPALDRDEAMRAIVAGALASSAGPAAALVLVRNLIRLGAVAPLLRAIRMEDGPALVCAFGWRLPDAPLETASAKRHTAPAPSTAFMQIARPWFVDWGRADARSFWLASAMLSIERPAFASHPDLPSRAIEFIEEALRRESPETELPFADTNTTSSTIVENRIRATGLHLGEPPRLSPAQDISERDGSSQVEIRQADIAPQPERKFTMCGGLFFLVAVMERLEIARWLERDPDAREFALPALVLRTIVLDLGSSPDDPILDVLEPPTDDLPESMRAIARSWIRWIRRYLRRNLRASLAQLVSRPARIAFTDTHIDVMFRFDRADIRVRHAGLDIDPGWTPWLGRVIRFRYVGDELYDA